MLALAMLFLTACNTKPPVGTTPSGTQNGETPNHGQSADDWMEALQGKVVPSLGGGNAMLDLPSRVVFEGTTYLRGTIGGALVDHKNYYYSKADGKVYLYCFDPLCEHTDCMASPDPLLGLMLDRVVLYNNRFYMATDYGQLYSFSFDGTDRRLEYDLEYVFPPNSRFTIWNLSGSYGPYLYFKLYDGNSSGNKHILRYDLRTKTMEDLTEKTENYISPYYFYNGMIYGLDENYLFAKSDLDLNTVEPLDYSVKGSYYMGNFCIDYEVDAKRNEIGIAFYNVETGEKTVLTNEELGLGYCPKIYYVTDEYIYFKDRERVFIGTFVMEKNDGTVMKEDVYSGNGKFYRMNLDGTNVVCVYENPEYTFSKDMMIIDDKVIMQGQYLKVENGQKIFWGGPLQVATINPDGTFGEFVAAEVLE